MLSEPITNELMVWATMMGSLRSSCARDGGVTDRKMGDQNGVKGDIDGVLAELAFCKNRNVWPDLTIYRRSGMSDCILIGKRIDIKATRYPNGKLLATLKDNPDVDIYVLAIIHEDRIDFPGFATSRDLRREENKKNLGHGVGYVLDQSKLRQWKDA
jgi:hypothetical protein